MGSIVYDACLPVKKTDDAVIDEAKYRFARFDSENVGDSGDEASPKSGTALRIRFPADYTVIDWSRPATPANPGLLMVYQSSTDEMVPLTQTRLDELVNIEKRYRQLKDTLRVIAADDRSYV